MKNRKSTASAPNDSVENAKKAMYKRGKKSSMDQNTKYYIIIGAFVVIMLLVVFYLQSPKQSLLTKPVIDHDEFLVHNSQNQLFSVGPNDQFQGVIMNDARKLFSIGISDTPNIPSWEEVKDVNVPENYDFRKDENRKKCAISPRMTGNCTAGHVFSTLSTIEDRICLQTNGEERFRLSVQDVISWDAMNMACEGGYVSNVLNYGRDRGFVREECYPWVGTNSTCPAEINKWRVSKEHYKVAGYCAVQGPESIKREIMKNGPVIAPLFPYTDFLTYKSGVYFPSEGSFKFGGSQAVKIVGWTKGIQGDSWIVENSWGSSWGEEGYANIMSGHKDLGVDVVAISPAVIPVPFFKYEEEMLKHRNSGYSSSNDDQPQEEIEESQQ